MPSTGPITIQKFIYLLSDFHYNEFTQHLSSVNAALPLKLTQTIRAGLPGFDTHETLCTKIYGSFDKGPKQNFNQLASYTFRLSDVLAQNYPDYLHHNINRIQELINVGQGKEANFLAEVLLEIATRTDDFQCSVFVLNFQSQQAFIVKEISTGLKLDKELMQVLNQEQIFINIQVFTRHVLGEVNQEKHDLDKIKSYLLGFSDNPSPAIRILSVHSYLLILYQFNLQAFETPEIHELIRQLEKELHNHSNVIFPYLVDVRSSLFFMKLNSTFGNLDSRESEAEYEALTERYKAIKYWNSFINMGQLYLITIQCTRLLGKYENILLQPNYTSQLPEKDLKLINELIKKCNDFFKQPVDPSKYEYEIMCYRIMHGILLLLSGTGISEGVEELEMVLTTYQQVNLNTETDGIFLCLILGYLSLKQYEQCAKLYKRYSKISKGKPVFKINDIKIQAYYYLSQWLDTHSRQYLDKFNQLLAQESNKPARMAIAGLSSMFKLSA